MIRTFFPSHWATFLLLPLLAFVVSCNDDDEGGEPPRPEESLFEILAQTEGLDSLVSLIDPNSALASRLASTEHTVFAPNNEAFANLLQTIGLDNIGELESSILTDILFYHLVPNATYTAAEIDSALTTFDLSQIFPVEEGDSIRLNENTQLSPTYVVSGDILANNGVIHVIDEVLLPPALTASNSTTPSIASSFGTVGGLTATVGLFGGITTINAVFNAAGLGSVLTGNSANTVLTPVNDAFDNFFFTSDQNVIDVANYHILEGNVDFGSVGRTITTRLGEPVYVTIDNNNVFLNGIFAPDFGFTASNGRIVHMAGVLKPADSLAGIVNYVEGNNPNTFTIFRTALEETGIDVGTGRTIFMPSDAAFEAAGLVVSIDSAARIDPAVLSSVLQTHVFDGINFSADVVAAESVSVTALNGTTLTITLETEGENSFITVDDGNAETELARVIDFDYLSTSGVVHVINQVLLPTP
ncbi:MAG: fasciclin domain-containing protein [Cyclobacteriaceae bacterium]